MARTHDLGPFFYHLCRFSSEHRVPLAGRIPSQEINPPFRSSNARFLRLPFTLGLRASVTQFPLGIVWGVWRYSEVDEEQALMVAMSGYGLDIYDDIDLTDSETRAEIRANIAEHTDSWDEEWEVINMLGVVE